MKKLLWLLVLLLTTNCGYATENKKASHQYNILDESLYSTLLYSTKEYFVKTFGNEDEIEGKLRAYFLIGRLNLPHIKQAMITNMQKENISLQTNNFNIETLEKVENPLFNAIDDTLHNIKEIQLSDCFISMYMLDAQIYYAKWETLYPQAMLSNATDIAISRFDNRFWFSKIKSCYQNNKSNTENMVITIDKCSTEYKQQIISEIPVVLKQLTPYKDKFENLYQIKPNEEFIRKYSKSGKTYIDTPKIMLEKSPTTNQ